MYTIQYSVTTLMKYVPWIRRAGVFSSSTFVHSYTHTHTLSHSHHITSHWFFYIDKYASLRFDWNRLNVACQSIAMKEPIEMIHKWISLGLRSVRFLSILRAFTNASTHTHNHTHQCHCHWKFVLKSFPSTLENSFVVANLQQTERKNTTALALFFRGKKRRKRNLQINKHFLLKRRWWCCVKKDSAVKWAIPFVPSEIGFSSPCLFFCLSSNN